MSKGKAKLALAKKHLVRVEGAWDPVDWDEFSMFAFYCLEAAVDAAALHLGIKVAKVHVKKVEIATQLHEENGLPDVSELLIDLNTARKSAAYGDIESPELDAQDVLTEVQEYVEAVESLLEE